MNYDVLKLLLTKLHPFEVLILYRGKNVEEAREVCMGGIHSLSMALCCLYLPRQEYSVMCVYVYPNP